MSLEALGLAFAVAVQVVGFIWYFSRMNSKLEDHLEKDSEMHEAIDKKFENSDGRFYEAFERISKTENEQARQQEINRNQNENWARIERKIDNIEGLLRNRRSSDQ